MDPFFIFKKNKIFTEMAEGQHLQKIRTVGKGKGHFQSHDKGTSSDDDGDIKKLSGMQLVYMGPKTPSYVSQYALLPVEGPSGNEAGYMIKLPDTQLRPL